MEKLAAKQALGESGLAIPPIIFGTSCLGNLYRALPDVTKLGIMRGYFEHVTPPVVLDTAGKYGAGLALEVIGNGLREFGIPADEVVISNKLGWARVPLEGAEPTFEPGAWAELENDARQDISYDGILRCWEQGCELLGEPYRPKLVSVHDPDEYLASAGSPDDRARRWDDLVGAYRALFELREKGEVAAVGVGSKDWTVIRDLVDVVDLDWVMLACSLTVFRHPPELLDFVGQLHNRGIGVINSAVFNAGFLIGGSFFDYREPDSANEEDRPLFVWRAAFLRLCGQFGVSPAAACVQFGLSAPGVVSVALNTSRPERVADNVALVQTVVPEAFWRACKDTHLVDHSYPYLGV